MQAYLAELESACAGCEFLDTGGPPWLPLEADPENIAFVDATLTFPGINDARLRITEDIDMRLNPSDPRSGYVDQLVRGNAKLLGYHRQPGEPWLDHGHDYNFNRGHPRYVFPAARTLRDVVDESWRLLYGVERPGRSVGLQ